MLDEINNKIIIDLYNKNIDKLVRIRRKMKARHGGEWEPQLDDTEAEITCLLLFHFKPKNIIEFSPCAGWSTSIILDAVSENNNNAVLTSFDITNKCVTNLEENDFWKFVLGDVQQMYSKWNLAELDYLFIDSDHTRKFTINYVDNLLEPLLKACRCENRQVPVSVHDVFHNVLPNEEGEVVIDFLNKNRIPYYTPSWTSGNYYELIKTKRRLNIEEIIHPSWGRTDIETQTNSAIFFLLS